MMRTIEMDQMITVGDLAHQLELPATQLIAELIKNGVMLTLNEKIDFETVTILIDELGLDVEVKQKSQMPAVDDKPRHNAVNKTRPPVVVVMGHVDHGKTSLLDKIAGSDAVSGESGGITQHISAQQVRHQDRLITFLDTPGHEAFAAVREHGALLTDLVVLLVAADDGIKEQTQEAIRFARKSGVKIVVAISKIDKPNANLPLVKQQLAENGLLPEDMGGQTVIVPISAKTGQGIDQLLDMILLTTDIEDLQADSRGAAIGLIIEAYMKRGLGPVAVVLVQEGFLQRGDFVVAGQAWGKARLLQNTAGQSLKAAAASTPVVLSGFKSLPEFGQRFEVVESEKAAKKLAAAAASRLNIKSTGMSSRELLRIIDRRTELSEYKVIIKADVKGSLTAVLGGLKSLDTDEVASRVVDASVGALRESDISTAKIAGATIYCFNLNIPPAMRRLAAQTDVELRSYDVIYELLDEIKASLERLLAPEKVVSELGKLVLKGIFKTTKSELICGGQLLEGKISLPARVRIKRAGQLLAEAEVSSLARGSNEVKEVAGGEMCGLRLATQAKVNLKQDDTLEIYRLEIRERKL